MSVETKNQKNDPFGSKKVTQSEVIVYVQQATQSLVQRVMVLQNALDTLYAFLNDVGVNGAKITKEEVIAYVQSKNAATTGKPNGEAQG